MNAQETGIAIGLVAFYVIYTLVIIGVSLASYIISSLAYYRIANRRGISNAWLAWIPVVKTWTQGRIAQEYDSRMIGVKRKWNVYLLVLNLVLYASIIILYASMFGMVISIIINSSGAEGGSYSMSTGEVLSFVLPMYGMIFVMAFLGFALNVCNYVSLYKVFESTVPEKCLKYMILSVLVPLAQPICLLKCSNRAFDQSGANFLWQSGSAAPAETAAMAEAPQTNAVAESVDSSAE